MMLQKKAMNNNDKTSYFQLLKILIPEICKAAPLWIILDCTAMALSAICAAFTTVMMSAIFSNVEKAVKGTTEIWIVIAVILATAGIQILNQILNGICHFTENPVSERMIGVFSQKIHRKISKLPAISFEDADTLDCINKAQQGAKDTVSLYQSLSTCFSWYIPYFIVMGTYLYSLRPILLLALVFIFMPVIISQIAKSGVFSKFIDESTPLIRKLEYYESEMYNRNYFKETRMLGTFSFVKKLYDENFDIFSEKKWKAEKKTKLIEIGLRMLTLLGYFGVLLLLVDSLLKKYIEIGAFAAVFASIGTMFNYIENAIGNYVGRVFANSGGLNNYIKFFNLPEETGIEKNLEYSNDIIINNVSFKYPNSKTNTIENVSLHIKHGETIAFVGENGAGKSTLVRLLIGILKPDCGTIMIDDTSTSELCKKSLFAKVSGVFQNFQKYQMSLSDNISISDIFNDLDENKMNEVMDKSDIVLDETYTDDINTMLSREFNGIDLSGGQWQRVALARGLYKNSELIILDEPTAAIDPIKETELYNKFKEISKGKTAVIVTHRLGSTKIADRIVVLKEGRIAEIGTHDQLISKNGVYAKMYAGQAKWYAIKENI